MTKQKLKTKEEQNQNRKEITMNLRIRNLSKTYGNGVEALKNVDLTINNGLFGLLGPNGAGKSTLIRTIATLQEADSGEIELDGLDVITQKQEVRKVLGYLPQSFGLYPDVTAEQLLNHIALLKGIADRNIRRSHVLQMLEQTNLINLRRRKLKHFSGGMKQRFGIAQALLGKPRLLIVDEPTAGLDPEERNRFHNLLSDLSENVVVILSTHIVDDIRQLCSSLAVLHEGEILFSGKAADAIIQAGGKIWQQVVPKNRAAEMDEKHRVVRTRLLAGQMIVNVWSDKQPEGFKPVSPELEDIYFAVVKGFLKAA